MTEALGAGTGDVLAGHAAATPDKVALIDEDGRRVTYADLNRRVHLLLGQCYEQLAKHDQQLEAYKKAVDADPDSVPGRLGLASAYLALGLGEEADGQL